MVPRLQNGGSRDHSRTELCITGGGGGGLGDPTRTKEEGLHTGKGGAAGGGRALPLAERLWLLDSGGTLSCRLLQTKQSGSAAAYAGALGIVQISSLIETRSQAGVVLVSLSHSPYSRAALSFFFLEVSRREHHAPLHKATSLLTMYK